MTTLTGPSPHTTSAGTLSTLELRDVTFGYGDSHVIEQFSARLASGKITALIGPNAAGKSTLLRLMLGMHPPWSGSMRFGDRPIDAMSPGQRSRMICHVPQRSGVSFAFTSRQVVDMARILHGRGSADDALQECGASALADRVFNELSVGQQQMVLMARAVAQTYGFNPDVGGAMLLDEPTSAMDLRHVHQIMSLLDKLAHRRGLAVLTVMHDLNLAARHADEIWLLSGGRLIAADRWDHVLTPKTLEPIYGVKLRMIREGGERPIFIAEPTMLE